MSKPKNILFLMTDQHRLDCIGYGPNPQLSTPHLDVFAESLGLTRCVTVNPICLPARSALLTGKYTRQIGCLAMSGDLSRQHPTYMKALQGAGYWTAAVGKLHWLQGWKWGAPPGTGHDLAGMKQALQGYGLDHVWEASGKQLSVRNRCDYIAHLETKGLVDAYRDWVEVTNSHNATYPGPGQVTGEPWPFAEEDYVDVVTADRIIDAIRNRPEDKPFALFGSFCSPHPPYDPPPRYLEMFPPVEDDFWVPFDGDFEDEIKGHLRRSRRAYLAMIRLVDDQVGRILDVLRKEGLFDDTVLCFTADHGEQMGDRGCGGKQKPWWGSAVVPCSMRHPDYLNAVRNDSPVELTDLTATLLDVAGLDPSEVLAKNWPDFHDRVPCRSFLPILRGETGRIRDFAFTECKNIWQSIQTEAWLYVRYLEYEEGEAPREELFRHDRDPHCRTNRVADPDCADVLQECRRRRDFILDHYPPAQLRWAPIISEPDFEA